MKSFFVAHLDFLGKTKKGALHKLAANLQWKHPCDQKNRPDFIGPPAVGEQKQFRLLQLQHQQSVKTAQILHDNDAHFRLEIEEIKKYWTLWRSVLDKSQNAQPIDRRK